MNDAGKTDEPGGPAPAVTVPAGQEDAYRQLAASAAILGKGLEDLAQEAMMLGAPDPAALGAEGRTGPTSRMWERCCGRGRCWSWATCRSSLPVA